MPCYHPLKAFPVGKTEKGKTKYKITGIDTECVASDDGQRWDSYGYILHSKRSKVVTDYIYIPCGQCIGCRLDYSKEWAIRMMCELKEHDSAYFITLTYNNHNVPLSEYVDEDGVLQTIPSLLKSDFQKFMKRLRKQTGQELRFYACGEYGSTTARPHYHAIIYGLKLDDLNYYMTTDLGFRLYTSKFMDKVWKYGYVVIGDVSFDSCAYVSRYVTKKLKGQLAQVYDQFNIEPEFSLMSRRPGIGKSYFDKYFEDIYPIDEIVMKDGKVSRPPRYFDKQMDLIDEDLMANLKDKRCEVAQQIQDIKKQMTSVPYKDILKAEELGVKFKTSKFRRS